MNLKFFVLLTIIHATAYGQYISRQGRFSVNEIKGCAPLTVRILDSNLKTTGECTATKPCVMSFETGNQVQNNFSYTYAKPGKYILTILYQSIGRDTIDITIAENLAPAYELQTCQSNQVKLTIASDQYDQYRINYGDGLADEWLTSPTRISTHSYAASGDYTIEVQGKFSTGASNCTTSQKLFSARQTLTTPQINLLDASSGNSIQLTYRIDKNIRYNLESLTDVDTQFKLVKTFVADKSNQETISISPVDLNKIVYCYRIQSVDPCTNSNQSSELICSHKFSVTPVSDQLNLQWTTATTGIESISILKDNTLLSSQPQNATSFSDTHVVCFQKYCYQLINKYPSGGISKSLVICKQAISTTAPPAIDHVSVNTTEVTSTLEWVASESAQSTYTILRSVNNSLNRVLGKTGETKYVDTGYKLDPTYCYQVSYLNACKNESTLSVPSCPIQLVFQKSKENKITLNWNKYMGWKLGVAYYEIRKYDSIGNVLGTISVSEPTQYIEPVPDLKHQYVSYSITAHATKSGVPTSSSNRVVIIKDPNLYYPNTFTPNHDGLNDTFNISAQFIAHLNLKIFDRLGGLVYESNENQPWNGNRGDQAMPNAIYIWKAEVTDFTGDQVLKTGTVWLRR